MVQLRPLIETAVGNVSESSTVVRAQIERLDATVNDVIDRTRLQAAIRRAREYGVVLPTFSELANPPSGSRNLDGVDPDEPRSDNLWRVNWYNSADRRKRADVPGHIVLLHRSLQCNCPKLVRRFFAQDDRVGAQLLTDLRDQILELASPISPDAPELVAVAVGL